MSRIEEVCEALEEHGEQKYYEQVDDDIRVCHIIDLVAVAAVIREAKRTCIKRGFDDDHYLVQALSALEAGREGTVE